MTMQPLPFFTDAELADLCEPLQQPAAQIRYLRDLGLMVKAKPNGRPLLARSEFERVLGASRLHPTATSGPAHGEPDTGALLRVIKGGRRNGQATQGR